MSSTSHGHAQDDAAPENAQNLEDHNAEARAEVAETQNSNSEERTAVLGASVATFARWCLRISIIILTFWIVQRALAPFWVIILPVLLGTIISTVLWPPTAWLRRHGFRPAAAAATSVLGALLLMGGIGAALTPTVADQAPDLAKKSTEGVNQIQKWVQGPPLNVPPEQIDKAVKSVNEKISASGDAIASGVFTGVSTVGSVLVTLVLSLILSFFFIKDGDRFLPWLRLVTGEGAGAHVTEVSTRAWHTLSGFIRTQAIVSLIDSIFIGAGLLILGVPLALPLMVLTFAGGFVPIVGAFVAGALAVLVALVTKGVTTALIVLVIVVLVQQVEGHVLQPLLQSRSMSLHPVLVLLGIAAGSEQFGVVGGFLAVPFVATLAVIFRYMAEQLDLRSGTVTADDLEYRTDRGRSAAVRAQNFRSLAKQLRSDAGVGASAEKIARKQAGEDVQGDVDTAETHHEGLFGDITRRLRGRK